VNVVPDPAVLVAYLGAAVALILAPGPDTVYVLTRGAQGRSRGVRSALGVATGVLLHTLVAALGLSALLRAAPTAYAALQYAGAVYLVYLGVRTLRSDGVVDSPVDARADEGVAGDAGDRAYLRGVAVNALNPKVALFFLAFLPRFAGSGPEAPLRMALLGGVYAGLTATYLTGVALVATRARRFVGRDRVGGTLQWAAGLTFVALGASVALGGR
jgi:threonine/homoserine/homoserine lactone efflux protein